MTFVQRKPSQNQKTVYNGDLNRVKDCGLLDKMFSQ